jgi:tRNA threonylcarbamoyladenosine biosynthesis protein TsaE
MTTANRLVVTSPTAVKTRALGRRLARLLRAGDVVLLQGPLGAGKTTLAQGIGAGLRVDGQVRSPTFVLMTRHEPAPPAEGKAATGLALYHADLYRLDDPEAVAELALEEQAASGVLLVEWPERGIGALPAQHLHVILEPLPADRGDARRITIVAMGERYRRILDGLSAAGLGERV